MTDRKERPVGLTRDVGYQIGARRTMPIRLEAAWQLLTSREGIRIWLGEIPKLDFAVGARYQLADGSAGEIRVFKPDSHLRITWHPPGWSRPSTIQVRVIPSRQKTVIAFHQEHLPDSAARAARRDHFVSALDKLEGIIRSNLGTP